MNRQYVGTVLAIVVGVAVDLTVALVGDPHWWFLAAIGVATVFIAVFIAWLLRPQMELPPPPPRPTSAVWDGEQINNVYGGSVDTDADYVHRGRQEGNWYLGKIRQRRPK